MNSIKSFPNRSQCGTLEVSLVGGFRDNGQLSQKCTHQLLSEFDRQEDNIHLMTLYVTELNDLEENEKHFPMIYGIAVNTETAEIHSLLPGLRSGGAASCTSSDSAGGLVIRFSDAKTEQLHTKPYSWMPFPHVDFWLQQILKSLSISPLADPLAPHIVEHSRST